MFRFLTVAALTAITATTAAAAPAQASGCVTAACVNAQQPIYYAGVANLSGKDQVWRVGNDGGGVTRITSLTDDLLDFSHDRGHTLVVLHRDASHDIVSSMNTDGTGMTTLATAPVRSFNSVSISPDGRSVAVATRENIKLITSSGLQVVGTLPGTFGLWALAWSPDGRHIAFSFTEPGQGFTPDQVRVLDVGTGTVSGVVGHEFDPTWSPDGRQLAAVSDAGGIAVIGATGTRRVLPVQADTVSWSPDGSWFAYCDCHHGQIRKVRTDGTGDTLLTAVSPANATRKTDWGYPLPTPITTSP